MEMNIEAVSVEQKRIKELDRANTAELVRLFENLTLDEQAAVVSVMSSELMKAELAYREANDKSALNGFMMMAEKYKEVRR